MAVQFSFVASPEMGPKALKFLLWRRAGPVGPIAIVLFPILLAILAAEPEFRPAAYVLGGAALMLFVIFLLGIAHLRRLRRRFFATAKDRNVSVTLDDANVTVATAVGTSSIPWASCERLWTGDEVILLFFNGWQRVALPRKDVPQPALDFIAEKLRAQGKQAA